MDTEVATVHEDFTFTGKAGEYFRIWLVNICLPIITIGIYSPWAKVRRLKYLYRSTHLAGGSFDYHASPIAILKGRLIGFTALAVYLAASVLWSGSELIIAAIIGLFIPWLIVRSRMFRMRNTSYQNIRFSFKRVVGKAVSIIFGTGLLVALSLGAAYPYYKFRRAGLIVDNSRFGNLDFSLKRVIRGFYLRYSLASLFSIVALSLLFGFAGLDAIQQVFEAAESAESAELESTVDTSETGTGNESGEEVETPELDAETVTKFFQAIGGVFVLSILVFTLLRESITKLILGNIKVGDHQLVCMWSIPKIGFIWLTNLVAIGVSLGLLIPWATVRMQRYKMEHLSVDVQGRLADIVAVQTSEVSAMGEELGEAFDIDLGI